MYSIRFCVLLLLLIPGTMLAADGGPTRPDRRLTKEPVYQAAPKYYLLAFGAEAKTSVWLVFDGTTLYIDRNANGDLTEAGERFTPKKSVIYTEIKGVKYPDLDYEVGDLTERDGKTKHTGLRVVLSRATEKEYGDIYVTVRTAAGYRQYSVFAFNREKETCRKPATAPCRHFAGPLQLKLLEPAPGLVRGESMTLYAWIETPHEGPQKVWVHHGNGKDPTFPAEVHPLVTIELPPRKTDGQPVTLKVPLDQRC
jgi:hypothetical protein